MNITAAPEPPPEQINCPNCQTLTENGLFCTACGLPLTTPAVLPTDTETVAASTPAPAPVASAPPVVYSFMIPPVPNRPASRSTTTPAILPEWEFTNHQAPPGTARPPRLAASGSSFFARDRATVLLIIACVVPPVVVAVVVAAIFLPTIHSPAAGRPAPTSSTPHPTVAPVLTIPGWSQTATWSVAGFDAVTVSNSGARAAAVHGTVVSIVDTTTGRVVQHETVPGLTGRVYPVTIDGQPGFAANTTTNGANALAVWAGKDLAFASLPYPSGASFRIRSGAPFIFAADGTASLVTSTDKTTGAGTTLTPVLSPRPGTVPLAVTSVGAIVWASQTGEVLVAAVNGTITNTEPLLIPTPGATITQWIAATDDIVAVKWAMPDGTQLLTTNLLVNGVTVGTAVPLTGGIITATTNQDGTQLLAAGCIFDTHTGATKPLPYGFITASFLGNTLQGATTAGQTSLVVFDRGTFTDIVPIANPTVIPVGASTANALLTFTSGSFQSFPPTPPSTKGFVTPTPTPPTPTPNVTSSPSPSSGATTNIN